MSMVADRAECIGNLARDTADRAKQVPVQFEQALARAVETSGDELVGVEPPCGRPGRAAGSGRPPAPPRGEVIAQPLHDRRVDAETGQPIQQQLQRDAAAEVESRAGSSKGSTLPMRLL